MRCRKCDYLLWNLPTRRCPECGEGFLPSEYRFRPDSVRFCCPDCDQAYYGTDEQGHLSPRAFNCVSCGRALQMDEMILRPGEGLEDGGTEQDSLPWLDRETHGPIKGWLRTIGRVMGSPTRAIEQVPEDSPVGQAWWFATVNSILFAMIGFGPVFIMQFVVMAVAVQGMGGGASVVGMGIGYGFVLLAAVFFPLLWIAIWGGVAHLLLRMTGRTAAGAGRTYQALCYGSAVTAPLAIPCIGMYVIPFIGIWWIVVASLMLVPGQRVGSGRAVFASVAPPLVVLVLPVVLLILFVIIPAWGSFTPGMSASTDEVTTVADALAAYAEDHDDRRPTHAIQLVAEGYLETIDLVTIGSNTAVEDIPVADLTLAEYEELDDDKREAVTEACVAAMPDEVVACRLGDYVFVDPGRKVDSNAYGLWTVIECPDPDLNPAAATNALVPVAMSRGQATALSGPMFGRMLAAQNQLRAGFDLPPLPHPKDVTHDNPAVNEENEETP